MDSFLDFCLACDRQTNGAIYCSQACRLADLDHSTYLPPHISNTESSDTDASHSSEQQPANSVRSNSMFTLPPAYNFSMHLHRVSSQTSISSTQTSTSRISTLSDQARSELEEYAGAFDQVRTRKRRRISL